MLEAVVIVVVLLGSRRLLLDVPYTGDRGVDGVGSVLSVMGMGGLVLGILAWQEGGESVGLLIAAGLLAMSGLVYWLLRRDREGKPALLDPHLFKSKMFSFGISQGILQQIALGGMLIALPIYLQMVLELQRDGGGPDPRAALPDDVRGGHSRREKSGEASSCAASSGPGSRCSWWRSVLLIPIVPEADSGWSLVVPLILAGAGLGLLGVPAQQLHTRPDLGGAGRRGRRRQLGDGVLWPLPGLGVRRARSCWLRSRSPSPRRRKSSNVLAAARAAARRRRARRMTRR